MLGTTGSSFYAKEYSTSEIEQWLRKKKKEKDCFEKL